MDSGVEQAKKRTHSFSKRWLEDIRYKDWIAEVAGNESVFYCKFCDNQYSASSSHVLRHAQSLTHNKFVDDGETEEGRKKKFLHKWLEVDTFKPWLQEVTDNPYVCYCNVCKTEFSCGLSQIQRHKNRASHIKNFDVAIVEQCSEEITSRLPFDDRVTSAEIRFAALIGENNIPFQKADVILNFFKQFSGDHHVLQKMSMGRTKCTNVVSNVLAPTAREQTVHAIRNTKFSVLVDETSDITNNKWMTFLVRYVEPQTLDIRTELVDLIDLDATDCCAEKIFTAFKSDMWKHQIPFENITALSCDNAAVMVGKNSSFKTKLSRFCHDKLLTLPCPCHSSALIADAACEKLPEYCEDFMRKVPSFIYNSPKRAAIFRSIQEGFSISSRKIARFCETRWLTRHACVTSILDNWDILFQYLQELILTVKTKSAIALIELMKNPELKGYLLFLNYILNFFNSFNAFFQASETRIQLLQTKSKQLLQGVLKNFLKVPVLKYMESTRNITFSSNSNIRDLNDIDFGQECNMYLQDLTENNQSDIAKSIQQTCLQFYIAAAEEICNRLPIDDEFLSKLRVIDAETALFNQDRSTSFTEVLFVCRKFGGIDETELEAEWLNLFCHFSDDEKKQLSACTFDVMWKKIGLTMDVDGNWQYPTLRCLLAAVRSLPNSNADSERSFSMLPDVKNKKRNRLSAINVNSICITKIALRARNETAQSFTINSSHMALMASETLYKSNAVQKQSGIQLHAVDPEEENEL